MQWVWLAVDFLVPLFFLRMAYAFAMRDQLERELAAAAEHDPLTGLPNRAGFEKRALAALSAAARAVAVRRVVRRLRDRRPGMVQTAGQYAAIVAAVRDEAAELLGDLLTTNAEEASRSTPSLPLPAAAAAVVSVSVPPGGLLSDEGSGEDD